MKIKRYLPLLVVIIYPYFVPLLGALGLLIKPLGNFVFIGEGALLLVLPFFIYGIALLCSLLVFVISLTKRRDSQEMLQTSIVVKLWHLPANLAALFLAVWIFGLSNPAKNIFLILIFTVVFLSGLVSLGALIRSFCEKKISWYTLIAFGILQFVFVFDIVCAILVRRKVQLAAKKKEATEPDWEAIEEF